MNAEFIAMLDYLERERGIKREILLEAVSNALRHGSAEHIHVTLERDLMGGRLVVRDDGAGFDVSTASGGTGFGLTSMRERALGLPGTFEIQSEPGEGTEAVVTW